MNMYNFIMIFCRKYFINYLVGDKICKIKELLRVGV